MSNANLPDRPSLEFLKKLAKGRLADLRQANPTAKLADAQLAVAREHGFPSWRALKAEVDRRRSTDAARFFEAAAAGDLETLRSLLAAEPALVHATRPGAPHGGWTALHTASHGGQDAAVQLLLEHGADPDAREEGDTTTPLHWAAARGHLDTVRTLLDAGADVRGTGDVHALETIGWATVFRPPDETATDVVELLTARGARHHIFSAIAVGDPGLVRAVVKEDPRALDRRLSRFERGMTPLHFAMERKHYDLLDLLIELGADLEAIDARGQTAFAMAMLRGDQEATRRLHAAGAKEPDLERSPTGRAGMAELASSVRKLVPMLSVPDVAATLDWYTSIGFTEVGRYADDEVVNWGMASLGRAQVMFNLYGEPGGKGVSVWLYVDAVDRMYELLRTRQLEAARVALAPGANAPAGITFEEDLYDPFYGGRQFSIRDLNGYTLIFYQEQVTDSK